MTTSTLFHISEPSEIYAVRRSSGELAQQLAFGETQAGKLAIVVTEAATNIIKHATSGDILMRPVKNGTVNGIEVIAIDAGPGFTNLSASLRDGVSTVGSSGTGLGAMRRLAAEFDVYTQPDKGSVFCMTLWSQPDPPVPAPFQFSAVCVPLPGQEVCGDAWAVNTEASGAALLIADGLGHGNEAAMASVAATEMFAARPGLMPARVIEIAHDALRSTRGAAMSVSHIDFDAGHITFAGVGNVAGCVYDVNGRRQMLSHNGIVGHNIRKIQEFRHDWSDRSLLIMHSDGLGTQWDLRAYPGLETCHPALIAGVLYRDFSRRRDDVTILVARQAG